MESKVPQLTLSTEGWWEFEITSIERFAWQPVDVVYSSRYTFVQ